MVTDVSESRLTMLFTEALTEPLRGWVKATDPPLYRMPLAELEISKIQFRRTGSLSKPTFQLGTRTRNLSNKIFQRKHG